VNPADVRRWLVIAASSPAAAVAYAHAKGMEPELVVGRSELAAHRSRLRAVVRRQGIDGALLHSSAWRRETCPQLFLAALTLAPVDRRYLVDEEQELFRRVPTAELLGGIARLPLDAATGVGLCGAGAARLLLRGRHRSAGRRRLGPATHGDAVIAVWRGSMGNPVGGAVTHVHGILRAFARAGFRVGLVTAVPPPQQLLAAADDVEVADPLSRPARITPEVSQLLADRLVEDAGLRLARRLPPAFVYQRHAAYLTAGTAIAGTAGVPLVLEWNASEVWAQDNWQRRLPVERALRPLLARLERRVAGAADLVAAVSHPAAEMARRAGAPQDRVLVVPNGVDVGEVRRALRAAERRSHGDRLLGWVGTFGPWHGAEILIQSLAALPADVSLAMVGDGTGREACVSLARSLGVDDRVVWLGAVPHERALRQLAACDVLVSPHVPLPDTRFFGSPTKLFEYMALGRPIVASRLEQLGEVLEDGRTARLVRPGDPLALRDGILDVLDSPDRGERLGRRASQEAARTHTWDHRAAAILDRLELMSQREEP
jgi:glycosyltransferase involved in cell wall biosynthesis